MGSFTIAEILWMIKELQCPLDLEAIGAFTRNDVTKVLRTFIMTECNNNIVAELPLEWRPLATRHVPNIKPFGPPASAAASSDPATVAEPEPTVDEIVQEMVAAGSGGNGAGSGDKDGDKDDKKDEEKEADPDYEPSSDEDEEKVKIVFVHKVPPNPPRKVPVMLPATDTIKEVRSFAAGLFRMKRKDVRMLLKAPEWGEMEMDDDGKTIYDYTVALFTNGCEVEVRFSGVGGMPPPRVKKDHLKEKNNEDKEAIPMVYQKPAMLESDVQPVKNALTLGTTGLINVPNWLRGLSMETLEDLEVRFNDIKKHCKPDLIVNMLVKEIVQFKALQAHRFFPCPVQSGFPKPRPSQTGNPDLPSRDFPIYPVGISRPTQSGFPDLPSRVSKFPRPLIGKPEETEDRVRQAKVWVKVLLKESLGEDLKMTGTLIDRAMTLKKAEGPSPMQQG